VVTRARFVLAALVLLTLVACGDAWAAKPLTISLAFDTAAPEAGDSVAVTARAKHLPGGYVVVIRVTDGDGVWPVETCRTAVCPGVWTEPEVGVASFQAFVRSRLHGGKIVARTPLLAIHWHAAPPPPPPPPPPPTALAGHYCGLSNEGKSVCFDVTGSDQPPQRVAKLRIESNVACGDGSGWWWWIYPPGIIDIGESSLAFTYDFSGSLGTSESGDATGIVGDYTLAGTFDTAGNVSGTIHLRHISWDQGGKHYDCAGDPRTWTARLGA
jgi:hypothetical protein